MSTAAKTPTPAAVPAALLPRLIDEGHGPDPWHGADILAALAGVTAATAARRPAPGRHNIAEIALHHAYWLHVVRGRLLGRPDQPFALDGEDWFDWDADATLSWDQVQATLTGELQRLRDTVAAINAGTPSPLGPEARFDQVLGISTHAAYHAGQVQLVKALVA